MGFQVSEIRGCVLNRVGIVWVEAAIETSRLSLAGRQAGRQTGSAVVQKTCRSASLSRFREVTCQIPGPLRLSAQNAQARPSH